MEWLVSSGLMLGLMAVGALLLLLFVQRWLSAYWEKKRFTRAREWAARHLPQRPQKAAAVVGRILTEELCVPFENLNPETRLLEDLGMDDLEPEMCVLMLQEDLGVRITSAEWSRLHTVGNLVALVQSKVEAR